MTRTILLSSFVLALMSTQGAFAAATAAAAVTSDDHHTISLESINTKTVNTLHPEAATP